LIVLLHGRKIANSSQCVSELQLKTTCSVNFNYARASIYPAIMAMLLIISFAQQSPSYYCFCSMIAARTVRRRRRKVTSGIRLVVLITSSSSVVRKKPQFISKFADRCQMIALTMGHNDLLLFFLLTVSWHSSTTHFFPEVKAGYLERVRI
jgi:hypothetical protein